MSAASDLLRAVNEITRTQNRPFVMPEGPIARCVHANPQYDHSATDFLDPLMLGDIYVFSDGSSLHYDYTKRRWRSKQGTIASFGGVRTLRRTRGKWQREAAP